MKKEIKSFIKRCQTELKEYIDERFDYYRRRRIFFNNSWIRKNPEKIKEIRKAYEKSQEGKEVRKNIIKRRAERLKNAKKDVSVQDLKKVYKFYKKKPKGYEVDHIIPLYFNGKHVIENLQYLTPTDNKKKGRNKNLIEFN